MISYLKFNILYLIIMLLEIIFGKSVLLTDITVRNETLILCTLWLWKGIEVFRFPVRKTISLVDKEIFLACRRLISSRDKNYHWKNKFLSWFPSLAFFLMGNIYLWYQMIFSDRESGIFSLTEKMFQITVQCMGLLKDSSFSY